MAVAALAVAALMRGMQSSQSASLYLDMHLGARVIAQALLEDERQAEETQPGERNGQSGPYRWRLLIEPATVDLLGQAKGARLYRLSADVSWEPRGRLQADTLKAARNR